MSTTIIEPIVTWEKLPDDFPLPDEPVDNIQQEQQLRRRSPP
ncbi:MULTISPECIES: hypothetical protein [unclassified Nostoc]|nr:MULTISPECIES: hypothetical protein [unclassified Nostoc]MDM9580968.1 hypothetical protein [Nostoc sp. GT001]MDZ7948557.1 hypothetical protein [Nostoc sp. EfeVER01]MDZ7991036.1 hypothetical protein [Nostoc sp. EspVER01]